MNHNGVEYILVQAEPSFWKWQFSIGKEVRSGRVQAGLMIVAAHRVQRLIDVALKDTPPHVT
jgi:hypothetical protein